MNIASFGEVEGLTINARFGECMDVREFITPHAYEVRKVTRSIIKGSPEQDIWGAWGWVVQNIKYPKTDRRVMTTSFGRFEQQDFFELPAEVVAEGYADCDGRTNLLVSLLVNSLGPSQVYGVLGNIRNNGIGGHAWVAVNLGEWYYLETTLQKLPASLTPATSLEVYHPIVLYNSEHVMLKSDEVLCNFGKCRIPWLEEYYCEGRL